MAEFLTKDDFVGSIKGNLLDQITEFDDDHIKRAIELAIEQMKGYLSARYDVDAIFDEDQDPEDRNPVIVAYCIDIALYHLYRLLPSHKVPDMRTDRYYEAKEWLEGVMECKINPPNLPVPDSGDKNYIKFGGNDKRDNHV